MFDDIGFLQLLIVVRLPGASRAEVGGLLTGNSLGGWGEKWVGAGWMVEHCQIA